MKTRPPRYLCFLAAAWALGCSLVSWQAHNLSAAEWAAIAAIWALIAAIEG